MEDASNVVFIEFGDKTLWPKGTWLAEPDYCAWENHGHNCIVMRDMKLGIWRGFVGVTKDHPYHGKTLANLLNEKIYLHLAIVHGGVSFAGRLLQIKNTNRKCWWFGFECLQEEDLVPLAPKVEVNSQLIGGQQIYRNFNYARRETNKLACELLKLQQPVITEVE